MNDTDLIKIYELDETYQCPKYCDVEHIHKITKSEYDKKNKIKIYIQ